MSRLPLEQMMASLRPAGVSVSNWGTIAGAVSVVVMAVRSSSMVGPGQTQPCGLGSPAT